MLAPPGLLDALEYSVDEQAQLAEALLRAKRDVYVTTLRELLAVHGRDDMHVDLSLSIDAALRAEAEDHAATIVRTYRDDLAAFVSGQPDLDPVDLLLRIEEWAIQRGDSRAAIIAVTEAYSAHADAVVGFYQDNGRAPDFDFGGHGDEPPDCPICRALVDTNPHPLEEVVSIGVPHIGCRQTWHAAGDVEMPGLLVAGLAPGGIVGKDTLLHRAGSRDAAVTMIQEMS